MKKKRLAFEYKAKTRDYFVALAYYPNFVKLLKTDDKPYRELITWLLDKEGFLSDESLSLPTIKELAHQLKIDTSKLSKYFKIIYEEILELNFNKPDLFKKEGQLLFCLSFKYLGGHHYFYLGLNTIPRVDDYFSFYFIKPKLGGTAFHVKKVAHDFDYKGHSITISLSSQEPNNYLNLLKEKAYSHKQISFWDFLEDEINYEMEERLIKLNKNL